MVDNEKAEIVVIKVEKKFSKRFSKFSNFFYKKSFSLRLVSKSGLSTKYKPPQQHGHH